MSDQQSNHSSGNSHSSQHHHHHHHHHHHRSSRRKREQRQKWLTWIGIILGVGVLCFLLMVFLMPQKIDSWFGTNKPKFTFTQAANYNGIDVSHHQGNIRWDVVAGDTCIEFVYIKATEGSTYVDVKYDTNVYGAKDAGLLIGSYHFLTSATSVEEQYRNFRNHVEPSMQDLLPMVDVEWSGVEGWTKEQLQDNLARFCSLVARDYGQEPLIYADSKFYNMYLSPRFDTYPLFIAHYDELEPQVKGAHKHYIWQRDEHGHVTGIPHEVDLDAFATGTTLNDILLRKN